MSLLMLHRALQSRCRIGHSWRYFLSWSDSARIAGQSVAGPSALAEVQEIATVHRKSTAQVRGAHRTEARVRYLT